jgi:hypothetical protein
MVTTHFKVSPLQVVVLLYNITNCKEAGNDADRTVGEIISELDDSNGMIPKGLLESALYCANMNAEDGTFWHPFGHTLDRFITSILHPKVFRFDKYFNIIHEVKHGAQTKPQNNQGVGSGS